MGLRLDTQLSRLLLDDGAISVEALEDAVQQQVVHGGALDTLLLEFGLVSEETISAGLERAWACESVSVAERGDPDALAVTRLPSRMAVAMGLCPFRLDEDGLHVMVCAPVDDELLDEVGALCGFRLVPHAIPEVRLHEALHRAYGAALEDRFAALLVRLDGEHVSNAGGAASSSSRSSSPLFEDETEVRSPNLVHEQETLIVDDAVSEDPSDHADISPAAAASWDIVEALAHLAAQDRREGIAQVAVSFALRFVPFAAVFGVRAGFSVGWHRAGPCEGNQFHAVQLEVPAGSVAQQVLDSPSPLIGKPPINEGNTKFLTWIGRRRPRTSLLIPIVVAKRTVGILYADGGVRAREIQTLSDLVAFGARIGPAFEALLRARHRAHADLFPHRAGQPSARDPRPGRRKVGAGALDGTSPFARNYTGPVATPPRDDSTSVQEAEDQADAGMRPVGASAPDDEALALAESLAQEGGDSDISIHVNVGAESRGAGFDDEGDTLAMPGRTLAEESVATVAGDAVSEERSDEEGISWTGALDTPEQAAQMLGDDSLADADFVVDVAGLGTGVSLESPAEGDGESETTPRRRRRAPLLFDDATEPLVLDSVPGAFPIAAESSSSRSTGAEVPTPSVGAPAEAPAPDDLVFPEFPRDDERSEAWTGALIDTVARGEQGGSGGDPPPSFSLPPVPEPPELLPPLPIASPLPADLATLSEDLRLAPAPLPFGPRDVGVADTLVADEAELPSDESLSLLHIPEVQAHHDSTTPQPAEGTFTSLIQDALPIEEALANDPFHPAAVAGSSPPPVDDGSIELHTADVDVSTDLSELGPYIDDVPSVPPSPPPHIDSAASDAASDDPNATQLIGADNATDDELVEDLESLQQERVERARIRLTERGAEARQAITRRFPGRLLVDPFSDGFTPKTALLGRELEDSAAELGPLIGVTLALGKEGALCAIPHLTSRFPAFRYASVFVMRALGDERSIDVLSPLLGDEEPIVAALALDALCMHLAHPRFEAVLGQVRPLIRETSPARRAQGAMLLGRFRDVASVPVLITLLDDKNPAVRLNAHSALAEISLQDIGSKSKAWRKWWEKARKLTRIEWLIDGLRSGKREVRLQAAGELHSLAGDDFGYRIDDTKRQRDASAERFSAWWAEQKARLRAT